MSDFKLVINNTTHNSDVLFEIEKKMRNGDDVSFYEAYNLLMVDILTLPQKKKLADMFEMEVVDINRQFKSLKKNAELIKEIGSVPNNEYEFVDSMMEKWKVEYDSQKLYILDTPYSYQGTLISKEDLAKSDSGLQAFIKAADPKRLTLANLLAKLIKCNAVFQLPYKETQISRGVESWTANKDNENSAIIKKSIVYNKFATNTAEELWDQLVAAITDKNHAEVKTVLKHFIWQIKRKMSSLPVKYHMMPVLTGKQEIGKSTIVKQLIGPVISFSAMTTFKAITDDRSHKLWNNYVLILDEMGNSTQSNIEEIKQKVTSDSFTARIMRTNDDTTVINFATMIGTSNKDLSRLVFDDTGMRRFFQISCRTSFDWDITNNIDYTVLWRSINESEESPLKLNSDVATAISELQETTRHRSLIEHFFRDYEYPLNGNLNIMALDLFREFQEYEAERQPLNEMSYSKFFRDMKDIPARLPQLSFKKTRNSKGVQYNIYKIGDFIESLD